MEPELDSTDSGRVMDVTILWIMPGVIDSHVHVSTFGRNGERALGYRQMAEAGVTTAIDFAGTMDSIIDGINRRGAGLNIGSLYVLDPGTTVSNDYPAMAVLQDTLHRSLREGSPGFKCMGGHNPLTPEATASAIEACNQSVAHVALHCAWRSQRSSRRIGGRSQHRLNVSFVLSYVGFLRRSRKPLDSGGRLRRRHNCGRRYGCGGRATGSRANHSC